VLVLDASLPESRIAL
jgi:threonine dehydrogenase-like Zn-dependent dehydrogenase